MADNPQVNTNTTAVGATNVTVAGDDIGGVVHQRVKVEWGVDGVATEVSAAAPLPVVQTGTPALPTGAATEATLSTLNGKIPAQGQATMAASQPVVIASNQTAVPVSAASLPLPAGASTEATLSTLNGKIPATVGGSQPVTLRNAAGTAIGSLALGTAIEGVMTSAGATDFFFSTANATTVQLAASATFTGTVESIISAQAWSIILTTDQPGTLTLVEYIDAAGLRATSTKVIAVAANVPLSRCYTANGNYFRLTFQNTGASTTTTLNINTAFGVLPAVTALGNGPVAINEINGVAALVSPAGSLSITNEIATASGNITTQNLAPAGTATAGSAIEITLSGAGTCAGQVTGTYTGALSLQVTLDGTNWVTVGGTPFINLNTGGYLATITSALQSVFQFGVLGFLKARITGLAAMTGTAVVGVRAMQGAAAMVALDTSLPAGTAIIGALVANQSTNVAQINGVTPLMGNGTTGTGSPRVTIASDNTAFTVNLGTGGAGATSIGKAEDAPAASGDTGVAIWGVRRDALTTSASATGDYNEFAVNRFGASLTADHRTTARTYRAAASVALAAAATDVFDLFGNATSTVVVTRVFISAIQTTAGSTDVLLVKRSTANTVGTRVAATSVPLDAADAAANSTPGTYTANPTTGTLVGPVGRRYLGISGAAALTGAGIEWTFGAQGKGIVLSGTAQGLAINLNGATLTGGNADIEVEWYEF